MNSDFMDLYLDSYDISPDFIDMKIIDSNDYKQLYAENFCIQKEIQVMLDLYEHEVKLYSESLGAIFTGIITFLSKAFTFIMKLFLGLKGIMIGGVIAILFFIFKKSFSKNQTSFSGGGGGSSSGISDNISLGTNKGSTKSPKDLGNSGVQLKPKIDKSKIVKNTKNNTNNIKSMSQNNKSNFNNSKPIDDVKNNIIKKIENKNANLTSVTVEEAVDAITEKDVETIANENLKFYRYDTDRCRPLFYVKDEYVDELNKRLKTLCETGVFYDGIKINDIISKHPFYEVKDINKIKLMDIYKYDIDKSYTDRDYNDKVELTGSEALAVLMKDLDKLIAVITIMEYRSLYYISKMNGIVGEEAIRKNVNNVIMEHLRGIPDKYRNAADSIIKDLNNTEFKDSRTQSKDEMMVHIMKIYKGCDLHHLPFDFVSMNEGRRRGNNFYIVDTRDFKEVSSLPENALYIGKYGPKSQDEYTMFCVNIEKGVKNLGVCFAFREYIDLDAKELTNLKNSINKMYNFIHDNKLSLDAYKVSSSKIEYDDLSENEKYIHDCKDAAWSVCYSANEMANMVASITNIIYKFLINTVNPLYVKVYEEIAYHITQIGVDTVISDILKAEI